VTKALSKENQEHSKRALSALFKPNRSISQAGYKHSLKAFYKYSINSLKKENNQIAFLFSFNILKAFLTVNYKRLIVIIKKLGFLS
jgi:hypothetical protein